MSWNQTQSNRKVAGRRRDRHRRGEYGRGDRAVDRPAHTGPERPVPADRAAHDTVKDVRARRRAFLASIPCPKAVRRVLSSVHDRNRPGRVLKTGGAGVEVDYVGRLVELGILGPHEQDRFSPGDVRRVQMVRSLEGAGIPLDRLAAAIHRGDLSLDFMDTATYERFSALASETFRELSARTGVPLHLLMLIREAIGSAQPTPDDRVREDELAVVPFIELQVKNGFRPAAIERLLRAHGDSLRRITDSEADWWRSWMR